ncbi:MAG: AAA family ATPase [Spirochaetales bacterium]|nr:AAA family ATPase [Spirochaetales bacterium]
MKIAVAGKGGVGKSTIVALIARVLRESGKQVIIIDADPDMNQASLIGVPPESTITPISELKELIAERTNTTVGQPAPFFTMNPKVSDIPKDYSITVNGITLLTMGTIKQGGAGCACPENAFIKNLIAHLVISRDEWVILDMEAGIEHLGRGTSLGVDILIIIVEPSKTSIATAHRIKKLALDIGIKQIKVIGNKIENQTDKKVITDHLPEFSFLGFLDSCEDIKKISSFGMSVFSASQDTLTDIRALIKSLE